jgi:MoxR-like ATPase
LDRQQFQHPVDTLEAVVSVQELVNAQEAIKQIYVSPEVKRYIVDLTNRTREHPDVYLGASPRGSLSLFRTGQARASMDGRDFVLPDDLKALAIPALAHRIILNPAARLRDMSAEEVIRSILNQTPVPGGDLAGERAG